MYGEMHKAIRQKYVVLHLVSHKHMNYCVIGFLMVPSAGDDDGISRLVCRSQGAAKEKGKLEEGGRGAELWSSWEVSMGSGQDEGLL